MKKYIISAIVILVIFLITIISCSIYLKYIQNLINTNTFKNLAELTRQDAVKIQNKLEEDIRILNSFINTIQYNEINTETEIYKLYNENTQNENFTRMAIMYKDGRTTTNDGEEVDLSEDIDYFFGTDEVQISRSRKSKVDMQEINIYSKKIDLNEQIVIMLIVETDEYERLFLQSIYNGNGFEYIINKQGDVIANSRNIENATNAFKGLEETINHNIKINNGKVFKIQNQILNNKNGQEILEINDIKYYISFHDIGINDWYLLLVTPENIITEELNRVIQSTINVIIIIVTGIVMVSTYIIIENIKKKEKLYNLAYIDNLTKLGNNNYFCMKGKEVLEKDKSNNKYIIILNIEKFDLFNKHYGHEMGNKLLKNIGDIIQKELENTKSIVSRYSNDTFAIIIKTNDNIEKIANSLFDKLYKIQIENEIYSVYPILGIYNIESKDNIYQAVDKAKIARDSIIGDYNKKYNIFDEKIEKEILEEHKIEEVMEDALENKEFEIYYQPKISLKEEKMVSAEALVRWNRKGEVISPGKFIPLFEKNRFIIKLDLYIFEHVCRDLKKWKEKYGVKQKVSLNVSKEHFNNENFIKEYVKIAKKYNIEPNQIDLEITESASVDNTIDLVKIMNLIKKEGFIISLDDFGTGYSSLSMLQDMPMDILKIDKSFIDKIGLNKKIDIIKYIIKMSKELGIKTVAEGVENKEQIEYLRNQGCDIIQGYYYSKPLKIEEFETWIINENK